MLDALVTLATSPALVVALLAGVPIGLVFGVVPGLGGKIAIIAALPFVFALDLAAGCVFLISLHAVVHTGGAVPSILFGIPGTGPSTAILLDGQAFARRGEAARALSAAVTASAVGGLLGAVLLAGLIPIALGLMKLLSYPEIFFLTLFGISFSALLSQGALLKGLVCGCLGLLLAFVGTDVIYGVERFTFDQPFLWDGVDLVAAGLALYAVPEMVELARRGPGAGVVPPDRATARDGSQLWRGVADVVRHRWLTLRTSAIGAVVGMIPGLGGEVAAWLCYGHAVQTARDPERFGKGAIEGIIGPEGANNSKEGGALAPTLFLGLPGSSGMAILLIALVPLGLVPGPELATAHTEILWLMVWALAFSNLLAGAALLAAARFVHLLSRLDATVVVPFVYLFSLLSIALSSAEWRFFLVTGGLALLGYAFKRQDWPRAPLLIGLILGPAAEDALIKSLGIWGPTFFLRPVSLLLIAALLIGLVTLHRRLSPCDPRRRDGPGDAR